MRGTLPNGKEDGLSTARCESFRWLRVSRDMVPLPRMSGTVSYLKQTRFQREPLNRSNGVI